jgi:hypothetical protein
MSAGSSLDEADLSISGFTPVVPQVGDRGLGSQDEEVGSRG